MSGWRYDTSAEQCDWDSDEKDVVGHTDASHILMLEDEIIEMKIALEETRSSLGVAVLDTVDILTLRDWVSKYIQEAHKCFR